MTKDEWTYIYSNYKLDARQFTKTYKRFALVAFLMCTCISAIMILSFYYGDSEVDYRYMLPEDRLTVSDLINICLTVFVGLNFVIGVAFYVAFLAQFYKVKKDLNDKQKIIEMVSLREKRYMPHNHSYHFIVKSDYKYSIEVSEAEYNSFQLGDEFNLELSQHAWVMLGIY